MNSRLLSILAVMALCATTPALADEGEEQPMLATRSGYIMINEAQQTADGGDYVVTNEVQRRADGGDFVVTNEAQQTADGGDYVVTNSNT